MIWNLKKEKQHNRQFEINKKIKFIQKQINALKHND
jgi:hypothetical protein